MDVKEKLIWFTIRELKTQQYIYEKQIETIDYALFLNELTGLYIEARDHRKFHELIKLQKAILE